VGRRERVALYDGPPEPSPALPRARKKKGHRGMFAPRGDHFGSDPPLSRYSGSAYLQEGRAKETKVILRRLSSDGRVVFLTSEEHLLEIAGLSSGREERLAFIREFSGTVRFLYTVQKIQLFAGSV
jgi:hypothetical protein